MYCRDDINVSIRNSLLYRCSIFIYSHNACNSAFLNQNDMYIFAIVYGHVNARRS